MGYDVHITRKIHWNDDDPEREIALAEWVACIGNDAELELVNFAESSATDGGVVRFDYEGICIWKAYSLNGVRGNHAWFMFDRGNISVKNPDAEIRNKMIDIAQTLNAKVQGDDGELYQYKEKLPDPPPWWKFW